MITLKVLFWDQVLKHAVFKIMDMLQRIRRLDRLDIKNFRCFFYFNDSIFKSDITALKIDQYTTNISKEFNL